MMVERGWVAVMVGREGVGGGDGGVKLAGTESLVVGELHT